MRSAERLLSEHATSTKKKKQKKQRK